MAPFEMFNDDGAIAYDNGIRGYIANNSNGTTVYGVNTSGRVLAGLATTTGVTEVRTRQPGGQSQVVFSNSFSGVYSSYGSGGPPSPAINASGDVVTRGFRRSTGRDEIYIHTSGNIVTVADTSGLLQSFGNIVDINDVGEVAYYGTPNGSASSAIRDLYIYDGSISNLIASHSDFDSISEAGLVINNTGGLIFGATANGVSGLFTGGNPFNDRVVSVGDTLDGAVVTTLLIRRGMLNDTGNFVFTAFLDDNSDGIADRRAVFFANAVAVPEPSSVAVLAFAALFFLKRFSTKHQRNSRALSVA